MRTGTGRYEIAAPLSAARLLFILTPLYISVLASFVLRRHLSLEVNLIGWLDTHVEVYVAVALNGLGRLLGSKTISFTDAGYT